MHVEHFMTKNPVAVDVTDNVETVAAHMRDKGVGSVVVLRNGRVAGIVTDRMLATKVLAEGLGSDTPIQEVMHENPATISLDDNIFSVVDTMRSANLGRRIPVVNENNELLGIVSVSDIAVIAQDLTQAVFLEETHHAMQETHILTGAKRFVDKMRRPTKLDKLPREQPIRPVTTPTPPGVPGESGLAGGQEATRESQSTQKGGQQTTRAR